MTEHMRIISLTAENVKKLTAVHIKPDGAMVQITGKNGQGKTSVLDSIAWALGGKDWVQATPIRQGEERAQITLELGDDKPALIVERSFVGENTYLSVKTPEGAKYPSPQAMLDDMVGALAFDPLEFMRMGTREQRDMLQQFCGLDFTELDNAQAADRETRKIARRDRDKARARLESAPPPPEPAGDRVDVAELQDKINRAHTANSAHDRAEMEMKTLANDRHRVAEDVARLERQLEETRTRLEAFDTALAEHKKTMAELPPPVDITALQTTIEQAGSVNGAHDAVAAYEALKGEVEKAEQDFDAVDGRIKERERERQSLIAAAAMPVKNLSITDDDVVFNGLPLNQASDSMQLRISTAIAAAFNPKLRVVRIRDGSLLDEDALAWLAKFAEANDLQIWIERVDSSGAVGIVMEDGHVRGAEPVEQEGEQ